MSLKRHGDVIEEQDVFMASSLRVPGMASACVYY